MFAASCKEKEKSHDELAIGNWIQLRNRAAILLVTNPKGEWNSSVKIPDVTGKIVKLRGNAKGTWYIDEGQMIITVIESNIEKIWKKNATSFLGIVELTENLMRLKEQSGRIAVWKKTITKKSAGSVSTEPILPWGPVAVNINKNRENDKNRYLCINLNLILKEMMPDQNFPVIHPGAREALLIFLSAFVFNDVKDFKSIKNQNKKIAAILNPYMDNSIQKVKIKHIIVTTSPDQVEEFMIEHSTANAPSSQEDETSEDAEKKTEEKS